MTPSELFARGFVCIVLMLLAPLVAVVALSAGVVWWGRVLCSGEVHRAVQQNKEGDTERRSVSS